MPFTKSLRAKVLVSALIPITVALVVVAIIALFAYERAARDVVLQRDAELANVSAARLAEGLSRLSLVLHTIANDDDVQSLEVARLKLALEREQNQLFVFNEGVVVYNNWGMAVWSDPFAFRRRGMRFPVPSEFDKVLATLKPSFSNVFRDEISGEYAVLLTLPIVARGPEFRGVVAGMSTLNALLLNATYSKVLEITAGSERFAYLVDGNGQVIFHSDSSRLGTDLSAIVPVKRVTEGEIGAVIAEGPEGKTVISGFAPVPDTDWAVITQERWENVVGPIRDFSRLLVGLLVIGGVLSAALIFFGIGRILRPIKELTRGAQRIAGGDFEHSITAKTGDEIHALAEQFNTMASALKESYAGLEKKVEDRTYELQESEERFRALFEESRDAIVVGHRGEVTAANQAALDLFGFTAEEAIGSKIEERFDNPGDRDRFGRELAEKGFVINFEARLRKEDGTVMDCLLTASRLRVDGDDPGEVQVIIRDITARKRAEEALRESETMLRQSEKMAVLGTLTAGVAHELNNPAAAVGSGAGQLEGAILQFGQSQSQLNQLDLTAVQQSELQRLTDQARLQAARPPELNALARSDREDELKNLLEARGILDAWKHAPALVNLNFDTAGLTTLADSFTSDQLPVVVGLLGATYAVYNLLTEIGQGAGRISENVRALKAYSYLDQAPVQAVDVHEGLDNTLLVLGHKLKSGISVRKEYAPHLPSIQANGSELNQVWTNIIDNAVDALEGQGEVTIRTRHDGEWVVIEIEDDGPGIPAEIQSRIFEPFFTTKPSGLGIGLGLDISHNIIVQKHQGDIRVLSEPGKTRFQVWLPVTPP